jgi:DNA-binding transcriptional LysR family regulator
VEYPFIFRESGSGTRKVFSQILEKNNLRESDLQEVAEFGSTAAVKEAVKAGIGIAVLSELAVQHDTNCDQLVSLVIEGANMQRSFYLIRRKKREPTPVAATFLEFLENSSQADQS